MGRVPRLKLSGPGQLHSPSSSVSSLYCCPFSLSLVHLCLVKMFSSVSLLEKKRKIPRQLPTLIKGRTLFFILGQRMALKMQRLYLFQFIYLAFTVAL